MRLAIRSVVLGGERQLRRRHCRRRRGVSVRDAPGRCYHPRARLPAPRRTDWRGPARPSSDLPTAWMNCARFESASASPELHLFICMPRCLRAIARQLMGPYASPTWTYWDMGRAGPVCPGVAGGELTETSCISGLVS